MTETGVMDLLWQLEAEGVLERPEEVVYTVEELLFRRVLCWDSQMAWMVVYVGRQTSCSLQRIDESGIRHLPFWLKQWDH